MINLLIKNKIIDHCIHTAFNKMKYSFIKSEMLEKLNNPDNIKMIRIKLYGTEYAELSGIVTLEFNNELPNEIYIEYIKMIAYYETEQIAIDTINETFDNGYSMTLKGNSVTFIDSNNEPFNMWFCIDDILDII